MSGQRISILGAEGPQTAVRSAWAPRTCRNGQPAVDSWRSGSASGDPSLSWRSMLLLLAAVVLLTQCGVTCDEPNTVDAALNLRTGDWVDTDFNLNQIVGQPHSISFRFMLQHPNSYYNNIIGESGSGIYTISKNTSASGGCTDRATLSVNFGGTGGVWPNINDVANGFRPNRWYRIVVTVDNQLKLRLYVDGVLGIIQNSGFQTSLQLSGGTWAGGVLRFG